MTDEQQQSEAAEKPEGHIPPGIGRMVHVKRRTRTLAGQIAGINEDGTINLSVLNSDGSQFAVQNVRLVQSYEEAPDPGEEMYACWMPYQVGQAQKTEQLQAELGERVEEARGGDPVFGQSENRDVNDGGPSNGESGEAA